MFKAALWALLFVSSALFGVSFNEPKEVLLLHSYHQGYKWSDDITDAIALEFASYDNIELTTFYMDTKRINSDEYIKLLAKLYEKKLEFKKYDLVLVADNMALDFALKYHEKIFKSSPIVFLGINDFKTQFTIPAHSKDKVTGVVEEVDIKSTIKLMRQMILNLDHILIINDRSETARAVKNELDRILSDFQKDLYIEYVDDLDIASLKKRVGSLKKNSAILFLLLFKDGAGKYYTYKKSLQEVYEVSNVPIFGVWDFYLGLGVVGGKMTSAHAQGEAAAKMALKILQGTPISQMQIIKKSPNRYLFDHNELKRFNLKIPVEIGYHEVRNKPLTFYDQYRPLAWSIILSSIFVIVLLIFLIANIIKRRRSEKALKSQLIFITTLLDTIKNPIFYKDVKGRYIGCNLAFAKLLGLSKDDVIGKTVYDLFPTSWAKEHAFKDEMLLKYPHSSSTDEATLHLPNKPMQHFVVHKSTFLNADHTLGGIVSIMDNITDRIQQKQFLIQQSKLAEMGEMIGAVAHQWNEPLVELSAIIQDIEMAYCNEELDEESVKQFVKDSMMQIQYMSKTLKDFRNFLKPSTKKRIFDVKKAIKEVTELLGRQIYYSNINLFVNFTPEDRDIFAYGYENEFKQVLLNIINNAKKKIINTFKGTDKVGIITINVYANPTTTIVQIIDDAGNIDPAIIDHVFDPYFSTTPGGTGLGLYIAKVVIEDKMGGKMSVANGENSAIFSIEVPNKRS